LVDKEELTNELSIEALLFASGKVMSEEQIALFTGIDKKKIKKTLKKLKDNYDSRETSIKIYEVNKTWRMMIKDEFIPLIRKIVSNTELSRATMETLAVIAFKYPKIKQSEVIHIRGTTAYDQIKELLESGFITRQKEGRSFTIRLTEKFFEYFDVDGEKDIKDVFKDINVVKPAEKQKQLGELGDLEVIEISKEEQKKIDEKNKSLGLEVVDIVEKKDSVNGEDSGEESRSSFKDELISKKEVDEVEENGFLDKIEKQIDELSKRNNEHDEDELFKRDELLKRDESEELKEQVEGEAQEEDSNSEEQENQEEIPEEVKEDSNSETRENENEEEVIEEKS